MHALTGRRSDLILSAPFPITRPSYRRKFWRDISGQTGYAQRKAQFINALGRQIVAARAARRELPGPAGPPDRLQSGFTAAGLNRKFDLLPYRFAVAQPSFQISTESGEHETGVAAPASRCGYLDGVVPGGNIDGICQLVSTLPKADFLISVPQPALEPFQSLPHAPGGLRRAAQVTLVRRTAARLHLGAGQTAKPAA